MPDHDSAGSYFLTLIMSAVIRECLPGTSITDLLILNPIFLSVGDQLRGSLLCLPELVPNASYCTCLSEGTVVMSV